MTPWITRDDATEWPPAWPDTAIVQVELYSGRQIIRPMRQNGPDRAPLWWEMRRADNLAPMTFVIRRARRLDRPKQPKLAQIELWANQYHEKGDLAWHRSKWAADNSALPGRLALHRVTLGPETLVRSKPE